MNPVRLMVQDRQTVSRPLSNTNSAYRQYKLAVVRQAHHERRRCSALAVRPEPVEGCECDVFKQNWYYFSLTALPKDPCVQFGKGKLKQNYRMFGRNGLERPE